MQKKIGIGASFRVGQKIQCLPFAGFFYKCFQFTHGISSSSIKLKIF